MEPISDRGGRVVGWKSGDVLHNTHGDVCAFVRGEEVMTFFQRHIGHCGGGLFRNARGEIVGTLGETRRGLPWNRIRRKRCQITPWLRYSIPAPRRPLSHRIWAIWDREIDSLSVQ